MIKAASFDLDGTILDSIPIWDNAAEMFLSSMGIKAEIGLCKIKFPMDMTGCSRLYGNTSKGYIGCMGF